MSFLRAPLTPVRGGFLQRVSPLARLAVGAFWLLVVILTTEPQTPALLLAVAVIVLVVGSGLPLTRVPRRLLPLALAAIGIVVLTVLLHPTADDRLARTLFSVGPLRVTAPALEAGLALALRLAVIAITSLLVFAPSDPMRMADSLVQQARVPPRFAYGTVAALRVVPLLAVDWHATSAVRRLRGLESRSLVGRVRGWFSRLLVLLVAAIRRASRMALAMDARGFDSGLPRSHFRPITWTALDRVVLAGGLVTGLVALVLSRT